MDATGRRLAEVVDRMDIEGFAADFGIDQLPERDKMSLHPNQQSIRVCLPKPLCESNIEDLNDPGSVDIVYWRELGVAMIDLNDDNDGGGFGE